MTESTVRVIFNESELRKEIEFLDKASEEFVKYGICYSTDLTALKNILELLEEYPNDLEFYTTYSQDELRHLKDMIKKTYKSALTDACRELGGNFVESKIFKFVKR